MFARLIPAWQDLDTESSLTFLSLPSVEIAIARVAARVAQGGHSIPEAVIQRRFDMGWCHFNSKYKLLVNEWALYDNSQRQA